jgi:hypothetical protein
MQRLEVSGATRPLYGSLGVKGLSNDQKQMRVVKLMLEQASQCESLSLKKVFQQATQVSTCLLSIKWSITE